MNDTHTTEPTDEETAPHEAAPERETEPTAADTAADDLRAALAEMRGESDRISTLDTGTEQVEAAERFAEDAGRLDEQIGSAARAADDDRG